MGNSTNTVRRRGAVATALGVAFLLTLGACGSDSKGGTNTSNPADAKKAAAALLTKALNEEVAGDTAQAKKDFTEVVRLDPTNKYGFYNLGLIAQNAGSNSEAENQYRLAISIDGKFASALYNLAI